jgi:solute carrier family 8 (sodium/calcium exchanger)
MTFCDFQGKLLPLLTDSERQWPNIIRLPLYLLGLVWAFLAIGIISDVFMTGIEKVTSAKRRVRDKVSGKVRTHYIWNATVANLTLMALGSSAPEILLSLIEVSTDDMFLGDLGAGTIVGSAAFNLLIISAVCVMGLPDGEVRYINQVKVYFVTAFFSVFAYLWLMFILMATSPQVTQIWEALITLLFCPLFVWLAYLADRGYFDRAQESTTEELGMNTGETIPLDASDEELEELAQEIRRQHGEYLTPEQVTKIMTVQYFSKRSRAYYRHAAMQHHLHRNKVDMTAQGPPDRVIQDVITSDDIEQERQTRRAVISFASERYAFAENCGSAKLDIIRDGCASVKTSVRYCTRPGTAKAGQDYEHIEGILVFEKDETTKAIYVKITDDVAFENDEEFYVDLSEPLCEATSCCQAVLGEVKTVTVVVIDDDDPGKVRHNREEVEVIEDATKNLELIVDRFCGVRGPISCSYFTEDHTAKAGIDYEKSAGEISFENGQTTAVIPVAIKQRPRAAASEFHVILTDPKGTSFDDNTDGGTDRCICTVRVLGKEDEAKHQSNVIHGMRERILSANNSMGNRNWIEQFRAAIFEIVEEDEDGDDESEGPTKMDYIMHFVALPWKVLFAFVPPPDYCGGWACFCGALLMIAVVTAIVGDLANLVGCCLGIKAEITAITFVALGTSLPDTFASMAAAQMDPYADASIGNITGSNSVNVFMGIGLSW